MKTLQLGSTRLVVSPIGLGLAALGRPGYVTLGRDLDLGEDRSVAGLERRCHQLLDDAYAAGVRYVDAARSYGLAEAFLASWLSSRQLPHDALTVASKWGYTYTAGWRVDAPVHEVKDLSVATLRRQIAESRAVLGDRLTLYQVHSATIESGVLDDRSVLGELAQLASEGLVIGLTVTGARQADTIRRAIDVAVDGVNPFRSVQATWNLLETSAAAALTEAHRFGWAVIVKEVLANGRLTNRAVGAEIRVLPDLAMANGVTVDAIAMAAALAQPWAHVVLSGAVTPEQLQSNLSALRVSLSPGQLEALAAVSESPDRYWSERGQLRWA
jgi:aryl-alcohol dehydrogenase-like predicted oxidoreductase